MPHLRPDRALERFSTYLQEDVRAELDDEFVRGQVGSMSSTLTHLSRQLRLEREVTTRQRRALVDGLVDVAENCDDATVVEAAKRGLERAEDASAEDVDELQTILVETCNDVLDAIDAELSGADAREAREPLYEFLRVRVEGQLEMLGRGEE